MVNKRKIVRYDISILGLSETSELKDVLTIGKLGQDINCNHPQISLRHCTLYLADGVLSIKDHQSESGVFIEDQKIPSDQMIIVMEGDKVRLGELVLNLKPVYSELMEDLLEETTKSSITPPPLPDFKVEEKKNESKENSEDDLDGFVPFPIPTTKAEELPELTRSTQKNVINLKKLRTPGERLDNTQVVFSENESSEVRDSVDDDMEQTEITNYGEVASQDSSSDSEIEKEGSNSQESEFTQVHILGKGKEEVSVDKALGVFFPVRLFSFLIDINLSILVVKLISSSKDNTFWSFFHNLSLTILALGSGIIPNSLYGIIFLFLIFAFLRIVANLIFKKSLGQLVSLISVQESSLPNLKAALREMFGIILTPFNLLLDIPALLSRSTMKEVLIGSRLFSKSHKTSLLISLILFCLSSYLILALPLQMSGQGPEKIDTRTKSISIGSYNGVSQREQSSYFHFLKPLKKKLYIAYPEFKAKQTNQKKQYVPSVQLFSVAQKSFVKFSYQSGFSWKDVINSLEKENPFFRLQFPDLAKAFSSTKSSFDEKAYLSQFKSLIQASLSFQKDGAFKSIIRFGPFVSSFSKLKNFILSQVGGNPHLLRFLVIDKKPFVHIEILPGKFVQEELKTAFLMGISPQKNMALRFSSLNEKFDLIGFYRSYLDGVEWGNFKFSALEQKVTAYQVIDYFAKLKRSQMKPQELKKIFRFYFSLGSWLARSSSREEMKLDYIKKVEGLLSLVINLNAVERKKMNQKNLLQSIEGTIYDPFIKDLTSLINALKVKDQGYFSNGIQI